MQRGKGERIGRRKGGIERVGGEQIGRGKGKGEDMSVVLFVIDT